VDQNNHEQEQAPQKNKLKWLAGFTTSSQLANKNKVLLPSDLQASRPSSVRTSGHNKREDLQGLVQANQ
jgi:hypothetical protein